MSDKIKIGVLGTANIGKIEVIPAIIESEMFSLYAVAGRNEERVEEFKKTFGFKVGYTSYDDLINDKNVEAVYIPLCNNLHKKYVIKCAKAGKHIICEKPLAGCESDVKEMFDICTQENVVLVEAYTFLHSEVFNEIITIAKSGEIGEVNLFEGAFYTMDKPPTNIRMQRELLGGSTYDIGVYPISLMMELYDEEPSFVQSSGWFTGDIDNIAMSCFVFPSGKKGMISTAMCSPQRICKFSIYGTGGIIECNFAYAAKGDVSYELIKNNIAETRICKTQNNYMLEMKNFANVILKKEKQVVSREFSERTARVVDKVLNSLNY